MHTYINMSAIKLPAFNEPVNNEFVETFVDNLLNHYLDEEGKYAKNYLHNYGDRTKIQMNCGESLKIICTPLNEKGETLKDFDKDAYEDNLSKTSIILYNSLKNIVKMLADKAPVRLNELRWACHEISISFHNSKFIGYKGRDVANLTRYTGAPAFDIILHIKPMGKFPVCAPLKEGMYVPKQKIAETPTPQPEVAASTAPAPKSAPTVKQTYANTAAGGGGKKLFTGK